MPIGIFDQPQLPRLDLLRLQCQIHCVLVDTASWEAALLPWEFTPQPADSLPPLSSSAFARKQEEAAAWLSSKSPGVKTSICGAIFMFAYLKNGKWICTTIDTSGHLHRLSEDLSIMATASKNIITLMKLVIKISLLGLKKTSKRNKERRYKYSNGSKKQDLSHREATVSLGNNGKGCGKAPQAKNLSQVFPRGSKMPLIKTRPAIPQSRLKPQCPREAWTACNSQ